MQIKCLKLTKAIPNVFYLASKNYLHVPIRKKKTSVLCQTVPSSTIVRGNGVLIAWLKHNTAKILYCFQIKSKACSCISYLFQICQTSNTDTFCIMFTFANFCTFHTLNPEILARILFSRIALKDIFAVLTIRD